MAMVQSIDGTPDENIVLVMCESEVVADGETLIFTSFREARTSKLAQKCMSIPGVSEVRMQESKIQVTRELDGDWSTIIPALRRVVNYHFEQLEQS